MLLGRRYCHMYFQPERSKRLIDVHGVHTLKGAITWSGYKNVADCFDPEDLWISLADAHGFKPQHVAAATRVILADPSRYLLGRGRKRTALQLLKLAG